MIKLLKLPDGISSVTKKNFVFNLLDGGIFSFGMSFVSIITVLPVFVKHYGGSDVEIGLIPVLWIMGFHLPQIFIANYAGNQPFKKKLILKTAFIQRLAWLLVAPVSYLILFGLSPEVGLILFFVTFSAAAISGGFNLPAWFDLISKITPVNIRG